MKEENNRKIFRLPSLFQKKDGLGFTQHHFFSIKKSGAGFTLIELLIVIAIIAILAAVIFVALDPLKRFQDSRDAARWTDVESIAHAIRLHQVDNGGNFIEAIEDMAENEWYMIVDGFKNDGCDNNNFYCDQDVDEDNNCVSLDGLVTEGYIGAVPVSQSSNVDQVEWDLGASDPDEGTGYLLYKSDDGWIKVQACESENEDEIFVVR